jgi:hypothetical protein
MPGSQPDLHNSGYMVVEAADDHATRPHVLHVIVAVSGKEEASSVAGRYGGDPVSLAAMARDRALLEAIASFLNLGGDPAQVGLYALDIWGHLPRFNTVGLTLIGTRTTARREHVFQADDGNYLVVVDGEGTEALTPLQMQQRVAEQEAAAAATRKAREDPFSWVEDQDFSGVPDDPNELPDASDL